MRDRLRASRKPGESFVKQFLQTSASLALVLGLKRWLPVVPASPKNSAYTDQAKAAETPRLMSVSIVAAPWRRFFTAALWNGQAPQTTTGPDSANANHCQLGNCSAGMTDISTTGLVKTVETSKRWRRLSRSTLAASTRA